MRLLIAEDDNDIRRALVALLQKNNYTVDETDNGTDAYAFASRGQYDGIILDIMMPGMDGLEVLGKLRSEKNNVPILLLTAKSEVEDRVKGDLFLNSASFELVCKDQKLPLSSREYQIMEMLMRTPTAIVTSDTLMEQVWGWDSEVSVNNIWVYISNLRKKLQQLNTSVSIRAVRGVGYCMEESR